VREAEAVVQMVINGNNDEKNGAEQKIKTKNLNPNTNLILNPSHYFNRIGMEYQ